MTMTQVLMGMEMLHVPAKPSSILKDLTRV